MSEDIYPSGELRQDGAMGNQADIPFSAVKPGGPARGSGGFILYELALTASLMGAPALAQSVQRVELTGTVAPRCSGGEPFPVELKGRADKDIRRSLTVRCSGTSPALSVRVSSVAGKDVTLTATGANGQSGSTTAGKGEGITAASLGDRLATSEGNLTVQIPSAAPAAMVPDADEERGPVVIVVSPEA